MFAAQLYKTSGLSERIGTKLQTNCPFEIQPPFYTSIHFFFCDAATLIIARRPYFEVSKSRVIRQTRSPGRTSLNEGSAHNKGLLPTQRTNKHNRRKTMPSVGLELPIPANKRLQTYALDRTDTGNDPKLIILA
jgi:hypothetical protein